MSESMVQILFFDAENLGVLVLLHTELKFRAQNDWTTIRNVLEKGNEFFDVA